MSTNLPDNRIRLTAPLIDFSGDVGETGQQHDTYPEPGQARFDWLRMFLIGLLSNQASYNEPINYRKGTFWLDLNTSILKIRTGEDVAGTDWTDVGEVIQVAEGVTLKNWFDAVSSSLADRLVSSEELAAAISKFFTVDSSYNITSFIMASPNGTRYKVTMSNSGNLITTPV